MGKIFYIIGKSSVGKDTIYKEVLEKIGTLKQICLYTTRPKRSNEKEGKEYHFTDEDGFINFQNNNLIIEERSYNTIHGLWRYFTVNDEQFENKDNNYLIEGVLQSFVSTKEYFGNENVIPIYIEVSDEVRLQRALNRERKQENPKYAELCRRFLSDSEDFAEDKIIAAGIEKRFVNDKLDRCINEICSYIKERI